MSIDKKEYLRLWNLTHKEEQKVKKHNWYIANKEKVYAYLRIWKLSNKDKVSSYERNYRLANKEKRIDIYKRWLKTKNGIISKKTSRIKRRSREGVISKDIIQQVYEDNIKQYGTLTCYLCGLPVEFGKDNLEHKIPLFRGGTNTRENLDIAHKHCNFRKGKLTFDEFKEVLKK